MSRSSRGRHSEPDKGILHDKDIKNAWTIILRKMAGHVHVTAADGLLFTPPIPVRQIRFMCSKNKMNDFNGDIGLWERPADERYHLVAMATPKAEDACEGVVLPMSEEALEYFRPQWIQVCLLALAVGWVTALDMINPVYPELGTTWKQAVTTEEKKSQPKPTVDPTPRPKPKTITTNAYKRDPAVAAEAKRRANGICQLCGKPAPFTTKKDEPYLETHHIVWLSEGGEDTVQNTAALCPNCHRRIHILKDPDDTRDLQ